MRLFEVIPTRKIIPISTGGAILYINGKLSSYLDHGIAHIPDKSFDRYMWWKHRDRDDLIYDSGDKVWRGKLKCGFQYANNPNQFIGKIWDQKKGWIINQTFNSEDELLRWLDGTLNEVQTIRKDVDIPTGGKLRYVQGKLYSYIDQNGDEHIPNVYSKRDTIIGWSRQGRFHRIDVPNVFCPGEHFSDEWLQSQKFNSVNDQPAIIWKTGMKIWCTDGIIDRDVRKGPAIIWPNGQEFYYRNGRRVRMKFGLEENLVERRDIIKKIPHETGGFVVYKNGKLYSYIDKNRKEHFGWVAAYDETEILISHGISLNGLNEFLNCFYDENESKILSNINEFLEYNCDDKIKALAVVYHDSKYFCIFEELP